MPGLLHAMNANDLLPARKLIQRNGDLTRVDLISPAGHILASGEARRRPSDLYSQSVGDLYAAARAYKQLAKRAKQAAMLADMDNCS